MKKYILIAVIISSVWSISAQTLPNTYVVKMRSNTHKSMGINLLKKSFNDTIKLNRMFPNHQALQQKTDNAYVDLSLIYTLSVANSIDDKTLFSLMQSGYFEYIQPKYTHQYLYIPNDNNIANQWHLTAIKAYQAWDICQGDTDVVIGILDSGIDTTNIDLKNNIKYNYADPIDGIDNDNDGFIDNFFGWNMADNNNDISPINIHGSFVAALAAAATDDSNGIAGVGFHCKFMPISIQHSTYGIINGYEAIVYAADHGCQIINCSWGNVSPFDQFGQDIINYATYNKGALVIAACGNTPQRLAFYPAAYENVLSVAATNNSGDMADFTTYDYSVDIAAPGQAIYSTNGSSYLTSNGTSFSAAIVSGVAALIKSKFPKMLPQQILYRLKATADSVMSVVGTNYENKIGAGQINAYRALTDSFKPAIALQNIIIEHHAKKQNDPINIYANIINYFSHADNIRVEATVDNPAVNIVSMPTNIGSLDSMQMYIQQEKPLFVLQLNEDITKSQEIILQVKFFCDSLCVGTQHIPLKINTYIVMDTNNQICTITDCGRMAYEDENYCFGKGVSLKPQTASLLSNGSFLFGNNANRISDNIYNNHEMNNIIPPHVIEDNIADLHIQTIFNDNNAGYNKFDIETIHNAYAWTDTSLENSVIHQFSLINKSTEDLTQFYVALYLDWDIDITDANRLSYDNDHKISYTQSIFNGPIAGVKFLSDYSTKIYAFDIDGSNLSMAINNGFSDLQKYNAMTTNRTSAGIANNGNDVSVMMSYGPLSLPIGDTLTVAYAFILGHFIADIQEEAIAVQNKYNSLFSAQDSVPQTNIAYANPRHFQLYPNPANDFICIENFDNEPFAYQIFDTKSTLLYEGQNISSPHLNIHINNLPSGLYIIKMYNKKKTIVQKFVKK